MGVFGKGVIGIGGCYNTALKISNTSKDKHLVCPCCFTVVAEGDEEKVVINGQSYHQYCLLDTRYRKNGQKEIFNHLRSYYRELKSQEVSALNDDQKNELRELNTIFKK